MTPKQVEKELERLQDAYYAGLHAIAARVRVENIAPFCKRYAATFTAGMGSWGFRNAARSEFTHEPEICLKPTIRIPAPLYAMLDARDIRGQDLGSQIDDVRP